jgi:hypothetical protein
MSCRGLKLKNVKKCDFVNSINGAINIIVNETT